MIMIFLTYFCVIAYFYMKDSKLDIRATKTFFMKFSIGKKEYCLWCPYWNKILFKSKFDFYWNYSTKMCKEQLLWKGEDWGKDFNTLEQLKFETTSIDPTNANETNSS